MVSHGVLESYENTITHFVREWPDLWGFIYEAENRACRDEMEMIRRRADRGQKLNLEWCRSYHASRPWEFTFAQLSDRRNVYWLTNIRDPTSTWFPDFREVGAAGHRSPAVDGGCHARLERRR